MEVKGLSEHGASQNPVLHPGALFCWLHQEHPSKAEMLLLALAAMVGLAFPSLVKTPTPLGSIPPIWHHSLGDGVQVSLLGAAYRLLLGWVPFFGRGTSKSAAQANYNVT